MIEPNFLSGGNRAPRQGQIWIVETPIHVCVGEVHNKASPSSSLGNLYYLEVNLISFSFPWPKSSLFWIQKPTGEKIPNIFVRPGYSSFLLDQRFLNLKVYHLEGWLKHRSLGPPPRVLDSIDLSGDQECTTLASSQVMQIHWSTGHTLRSTATDLRITTDIDKQTFAQEGSNEESKGAGHWQCLGRKRVYKDDSLRNLPAKSLN